MRQFTGRLEVSGLSRVSLHTGLAPGALDYPSVTVICLRADSNSLQTPRRAPVERDQLAAKTVPKPFHAAPEFHTCRGMIAKRSLSCEMLVAPPAPRPLHCACTAVPTVVQVTLQNSAVVGTDCSQQRPKCAKPCLDSCSKR